LNIYVISNSVLTARFPGEPESAGYSRVFHSLILEKKFWEKWIDVC